MLRPFLVVAAIAAAATAVVAAASAGTVTQQRIDDRFQGSTIDPDVWAFWGTNQPGFLTFAQGGGALTVNVAAGAQPDFNVGGSTRCLARGDFDARLDYSLPTWPARSGVWVSLMITGTPFNVYRVSWQFDPNEQNGAFLPPVGNTLPATGTAGRLRLARRGDVISAYFRSGKHWIPLISGIGPTGDVALTLAVFNISNASPFAGVPVTVSFDHFRVDADAIVCP